MGGFFHAFMARLCVSGPITLACQCGQAAPRHRRRASVAPSGLTWFAPHQARARLEALAGAWVGGFTGPQLADALRDREGLSRPRAWIMGELRRLEEAGRLEADDYGYWHPIPTS